MRSLRFLLAPSFLSAIVLSCTSSAPEEIACITSFDCPAGQVCGEDGFCTDPAEGTVDRDKDTFFDQDKENADFTAVLDEETLSSEEETELTEPNDWAGDAESEDSAEENDDTASSIDEGTGELDEDMVGNDAVEGTPDAVQDSTIQPDTDDADQPDMDTPIADLPVDTDTTSPDPDLPPDDDTTQSDPDTTVDNDVPTTRTFTCSDKPANSVWNTVSSYEQTWTGTGWTPPDSSTIYNETPTTTACHFICATDFSWDGTQCVAIPHECSSNLDCTSDPNRPVCDTTVSPRKCVMCLQNSDCHTQYGEQCDIGARQCWAGFTCQHALWNLPHGGLYDWEDGLQGWQETTNAWKRRSGYYTPAHSGVYSFGYLQSPYCDWEYGTGCYEANWDETAQLGTTYDMSPCAACTVQVSLYYTGRVEYNEYGDSPDPFYARCSGTGGASWINGSALSPYYYYDSEYGSWNWGWHQWNLPAECLTSTFAFGLRFTSNSWNNEVGVVVDDLVITHPTGTLPKGSFDAVTNGPGSVLWGWTCDADNYGVPLLVQIAFYPNGNTNVSPVVKWLRAATLREEAVGTECGGNSYHGFYYALEDSIVSALGSGTHTAYAWAVNIPGSGWGALCGGHFTLLGTKQFTLP